MRKQLLFIIIALFAFTSCYNEAKETTNRGDFQLELLFEHEGCKMYRFRDGMRCIYWSNCTGNTEYRHGKHGQNREQSITN